TYPVGTVVDQTTTVLLQTLSIKHHHVIGLDVITSGALKRPKCKDIEHGCSCEGEKSKTCEVRQSQYRYKESNGLPFDEKTQLDKQLLSDKGAVGIKDVGKIITHSIGTESR
ncbi:MAG: hypothetical protein FWE95_09390, partial [Planctomycetaceae bacterium]|nr:hypothetical protein [Planctomycetaceae bacterium]